MRYTQLKELCNCCELLGIRTVGELAQFKEKNKCRTNDELLNKLKHETKGGQNGQA